MAILEVKDLTKNFGATEVLKGITFELQEGKVLSVIGSSGSGKTTLLRCINGLETATSGKITVNDQVVFDSAITDKKEIKALEKNKQNIGLVFQQFNLFPNMTILENIMLAPVKLGKMTKEEANTRAMELLKRIGLADKAGAYPAQLSGGQKQRVAIARALATNPRYLLCDEATSALDPNTTRSILELLREINKTLGVTIIVITHEMKVIDQICDRVAVIDKSCIAEEGRVADVFTNPKSDIARELVLPQERPVLDPTTGGRKLRLIFNGEDTQKPVISEMILACRVPVNVLFADTKSVEGAAYGHMILELPNDEHDAEKVVSWLKNSGLMWKEER